WLREFDQADAPAVQRWTGDPDVVRYVPLDRTDPAGAESYVAGLVAESAAVERSAYTLAIVERASAEAVGAVALTIDSRRHRRGELGYLLRRDRWGQGLATEAAALAVSFGFSDLGLHRIWAVCDPDNAASGRVLTKIGMTREGLLRDDLLVDGGWRDSVIYAALADEWPDKGVYL
ncbi:MAG: GNAT family N-acetyltransferase, partial [Acidimicrobiia bacterium]|nr:GNAT family N-acetyltransferase [Acidimicrobiia bacterium]